MKKIFKYALEVVNHQTVVLPIGAQILCVQVQYGKPQMWALIDPAIDTEERVFEIFSTGHPIPEDMGVDRRYIGTFMLDEESLVFHIFERIS